MSLVSYRAVVASGKRRAIFLPGVPPPPVLPPHAMRAIPTTMRAGTNLNSFMRLTSQIRIPCRLLPEPFDSGRECAGKQVPTPSILAPLAPARESIAQPPKFVKRAIVQPTLFVQALDKPPRGAMIRCLDG